MRLNGLDLPGGIIKSQKKTYLTVYSLFSNPLETLLLVANEFYVLHHPRRHQRRRDVARWCFEFIAS